MADAPIRQRQGLFFWGAEGEADGRYAERPMRVLLVSHLFPPKHSAGTEVYTAELGRRLAARGHEVTVFATDKDIARADLSIQRRSFAGLDVIELTNNLFYEEFRETWSRPAVDRAFEEVLEEVKPDVVHFQHLMYLSSGCLELASARAGAVLFTLHDFWLQCPRFGQLVHADGDICHTVDFARCGTCLPSFKWRQSDLERRTGRVIAGVHGATGIDLGGIARQVGAATARPGPAAEVSAEDAASFTDEAATRADSLKQRVIEHVDRFVSPSRFLRDRFVSWGLPADQIEYVPTGVDVSAFADVQRNESPKLRVAFLGTLVPLKGALDLVQAWGKLDPALRERGQLDIYGPADHAPAYVDELQVAARDAGVNLAGAVARDDVPRVLAETDLLVVPSRWYENRPLVVLEAFAARTPLCVADLGGMAELVEDGVQGWRFPAGDTDALAARLGALLADPAPLAALYRVEPELPTWEALTDRMLALYSAAAAEREE
jgi:glycosyltransferase involved in cell wall biosynthesis